MESSKHVHDPSIVTRSRCHRGLAKFRRFGDADGVVQEPREPRSVGAAGSPRLLAVRPQMLSDRPPLPHRPALWAFLSLLWRVAFLCPELRVWFGLRLWRLLRIWRGLAACAAPSPG